MRIAFSWGVLATVTGCLAPALHAARMASPGEVVLTGTLQGPDLNGSDAPALGQAAGSVAVGVAPGLQLEGAATADWKGSGSAGGGVRWGFDGRRFAELGVSLGGVVELGSPEWKHFRLLAGGAVGVPVLHDAESLGHSLIQLSAGAGGLVRF